jgi:head-tail adaptor
VGLSLLLTQRVEVLNPTRVSNGRGGWTESWVSAGVVGGRLTIPTRSRKVGESARGGQVTHTEVVDVWLDASLVTVNEQARLRCDSVDYEVLQVDRQDGLVYVLARRV